MAHIGEMLPTRIRDDFPNVVREVEHAWIPLADGTRLACRYWLPEDAHENPVPAILEYIPYCTRDGTSARDEAMHPYFAGHGYAAVRVDMRGSGESDGVLEDEYLKREQDDALEVIAWLAKQPWCAGRVGMMGKSWGGFNGLQVAARRPPALKCIITVYSTDDRYADDIHYMGGCLLTENPNWSFAMFPSLARPPDPELVGDGWEETWQRRLENTRPWIIDWIKHQRRDGFWKHGSVCEDFSAIECPVFAVGGWADPYTNPAMRLLEKLKVPRKALVGPWGHQYPHQANPGPMAGFLQEALRWWDHWLKDIDTGIMAEPMLRAWMHDGHPPRAIHDEMPGGWIGEPDWPSSNIGPRRFHLNAEGLSDREGPQEERSIASPETTGECTPVWGNNGNRAPECPVDQRMDDALSLVFDSPTLSEPLAFLGAPVVELDVSANQPQAFVAVRLSEVLADGAVSQVSYGLVNLTHDAAHETVTPLVPGSRRRVRVQLNDNAHRFRAGSRIRVAISNAFWPIVWPSPHPVTLTVVTGTSTLHLPIRPDRAEDSALAPLPYAEQSRIHPRTTIEAAVPTVARFERDVATGALDFVHEEDDGKVRLHHGWTTSDRTRRRYHIEPDDPTSACVSWHGLQSYGRTGAFDIEIEATQSIRCTKTDFVLHATLEARRDGRPVFARSWLEHIPRDGV
jgi:putative CocE/NonD family hydrolase